MSILNFTDQDYLQIEEAKITLSTIEQQLQFFIKGLPPTNLDRACSIGDGIEHIDPAQQPELLNWFDKALKQGRLSKFVPASGAASRMFKSLSTILDDAETRGVKEMEHLANSCDEDARFLLYFFQNLQRFAFYPDLAEVFTTHGLELKKALAEFNYKIILKYLLTDAGLNYSSLPKGLIPFHRYGDQFRTAFEEQVAEGVVLTRDSKRTVRMHFTVPGSYLEQIRQHLTRFCDHAYPQEKFEFTWSIQKPSTDTIAVTPENEPFRTSDGKILLRPGGHGALLENLNDLTADIVLIKNIDNILPESRRGISDLNRQLLTGRLLKIQSQIFEYLTQLTTGQILTEHLKQVAYFIQTSLHLAIPAEWPKLNENQKSQVLIDLLNRPLRVCGMVKNEDEPGGGPFWVKSSAGELSLQIVETSQIDQKDEDQNRILKSATHFNPADLVCGLRDFQGHKFDLFRYRDPEAGFISHKSQDGKDLKALEHPGLWNGAMAHWITIFVEVPVRIFNPAKTVNDLLREGHQ